jgi:hypothetical protein
MDRILSRPRALDNYVCTDGLKLPGPDYPDESERFLSISGIILTGERSPLLVEDIYNKESRCCH